MKDNDIIEEAIRLVREGVNVTLPVIGLSMLPFIIGGNESGDFDSRDDVVTVVLFPDDSKNHPFCYLSAKTKKKNIFLPIYLENWNKYITFAA